MEKERLQLGQVVRMLREGRGWSLREMAERSGISHNQVMIVEKGQINPGLETVQGLARAFGISVGELLGEDAGEQSMHPAPEFADFTRELRLLSPGDRDLALRFVRMLRIRDEDSVRREGPDARVLGNRPSAAAGAGESGEDDAGEQDDGRALAG